MAGGKLFPENSFQEAELAACGERLLEAARKQLEGGCALLFEGKSLPPA